MRIPSNQKNKLTIRVVPFFEYHIIQVFDALRKTKIRTLSGARTPA